MSLKPLKKAREVTMIRTATTAAFFTGALLVFAGCHDVPDVTSPSLVDGLASRAARSDALHGNGTPGIYFLPPMVPDPATAFSGAFDGTLPAVVEVWQLNGSTLGTLLTSFSTTTGKGSSRVRVDLTAEHYIVNWKADVDPIPHYRIRILVAGRQLGFADVDVVTKGSELKDVNPSEFVGVVRGSTLPIKFRIEKGTILVAGPAGGTFTAAGGAVTFQVPAGVVPEGQLFELTASAVESYPTGAGFSVLPGTVFNFGPEGVAFSPPITVTVHYDPNQLGGASEGLAKLYKIVNGDWVVVPGSIVNPDDNTVTAELSGFSPYGIVVPTATGQLLIGFGTPVVNGTIAAGEWDAAAQVPFSINLPEGGTAAGTLYVMNDANNVYFALRFSRTAADEFMVLQVDLDTARNGLTENDDRIQLEANIFAGATTITLTDGHLGTASNGYPSVVDALDLNGDFKNDGTYSMIELEHPLKSGKSGDIDAAITSQPKQRIGLNVLVAVLANGNAPMSQLPTGVTTLEMEVTDGTPLATTTSLSTNADIALVGAPLVLTATVSPAPLSNQSPEVEFFDGTTSLGKATPNANGVATLSISTLGLSIHSLKAKFLGTTNFVTSSSVVVTQHMIQTFDDLASFTAALGGATKQTEDFQSYAHGTSINSIFGGVLDLTSPFARLEVWAPFGAPDKVLFGFETPNSTRLAGGGRYDFKFNAIRNALAFDITAQDPQSSPVEVTVVLTPNTIFKKFLESNTGTELTRNFFGVIATLSIQFGTIKEGLETGTTGNEEIALDNFVIANVPF